MKTRESNFDKDSPPGTTFPKINLEKDLPNLDKLSSLGSNRFLSYYEANKLNTSEKDEETRNNSKYSFVVPWQMPE